MVFPKGIVRPLGVNNAEMKGWWRDQHLSSVRTLGHGGRWDCLLSFDYWWSRFPSTQWHYGVSLSLCWWFLWSETIWHTLLWLPHQGQVNILITEYIHASFCFLLKLCTICQQCVTVNCCIEEGSFCLNISFSQILENGLALFWCCLWTAPVLSFLLEGE